MTSLVWHDLQFILRRTPSKVLARLKQHPGQLFLAGGAIRSIVAGEPVADFDLFAASKALATVVANQLAFSLLKPTDPPTPPPFINGPALGVHETDNAYTVTGFSPSVQIIHRWTFDSPEKCIESFDFTIAQAAVWWETESSRNGPIKTDEPDTGRWRSCCADRFYADLAGKRLIYTRPVREEEPGGSLLRVLKFYQRGYRIPLDSLSDVLARLDRGVNRHLITSLPEADREAQLSKVLCGLLREVDPNVDPAHIAHLPAESVTEDQL